MYIDIQYMLRSVMLHWLESLFPYFIIGMVSKLGIDKKENSSRKLCLFFILPFSMDSPNEVQISLLWHQFLIFAV